ncbi:hypothetical protein G7Y89_g3887 [Cudoniella acicularis]|uniref:Rhodopsin domain-containing protein n=1 Tax=Cudoniella acicularis TaxID=354080 RepID=A0A8H4W5I1_9HELO|nr:hypothetical protein G7Y89_g3887 [Cudoniella acicularis]
MASPLPALTPADLAVDHFYQLTVSAITTFTLASIAIPLRFYCRKITKQPLWLDDYFIIVAYIAGIGLFIVIIIWAIMGMGKHAQVVPVPRQTIVFKTLTAGELTYGAAIVFTKYSILAFYWRLFSGTASVLACIPLRKLWKPDIPGACINLRTFYVANAIPNVLTDSMMLFMPMPHVWGLKISLPRKIGVMMFFVVGGFTCIVSLIRLVFMFRLDTIGILWGFTDLAVWTGVETNSGIICACLTTLRPLFQKLSTPEQASYMTSNSKPSKLKMDPESSIISWRNKASNPDSLSRRGSHSSFVALAEWEPTTTSTAYAANRGTLEYNSEESLGPVGPNDIVMMTRLELKEGGSAANLTPLGAASTSTSNLSDFISPIITPPDLPDELYPDPSFRTNSSKLILKKMSW